jgi:hypothetical protein
MENTDKKASALNKFLGKKQVNNKKVILDEREGLIERVDKVYVTKEGKQLLREQY